MAGLSNTIRTSGARTPAILAATFLAVAVMAALILAIGAFGASITSGLGLAGPVGMSVAAVNDGRLDPIERAYVNERSRGARSMSIAGGAGVVTTVTDDGRLDPAERDYLQGYARRVGPAPVAPSAATRPIEPAGHRFTVSNPRLAAR